MRRFALAEAKGSQGNTEEAKCCRFGYRRVAVSTASDPLEDERLDIICVGKLRPLYGVSKPVINDAITIIGTVTPYKTLRVRVRTPHTDPIVTCFKIGCTE